MKVDSPCDKCGVMKQICFMLTFCPMVGDSYHHRSTLETYASLIQIYQVKKAQHKGSGSLIVDL